MNLHFPLLVWRFVTFFYDTKSEILSKNSGDKSLFYPGDDRFLAAILADNDFQCSGALLTTSILVTAASCYADYKTFNYCSSKKSIFTVRAGTVFWDKGGQVRRVSQFIVHPGYKSALDDATNDITLAKVKKPFVYGLWLKPISYANSSERFSDMFLQTVGWGVWRYHFLNMNTNDSISTFKTETSPVSTSWCQNVYQSVGYNISKHMICAFGNQSPSFCFQDIGSPMWIPRILFGILSWGMHCPLSTFPAIYVNISYHSSWITQNIQDFT